MIVDVIKTDYQNELDVPQRHIAFAAVQDGDDVRAARTGDVHVARSIGRKYWPELAERGEMKLGDFISRQVESKTLHAFICWSWGPNGWKQTPEIVTKCLDSLDVAEDEILAVYLMGHGITAIRSGASSYAILGGIARSKKRVVVYV